MKNNYLRTVVFICCFMPVFFCFAQGIKPIDKSIREKRSIPKVLPTELQNAYDVKWYFLNLYAENNTVALSGDVTIKAEAVLSVVDTFSFHLHQVYEIDSLKVNGILRPVKNNGDERWVTDLAFSGGDIFDVQIFYHGSMVNMGTFFSGISSAIDPDYDFNVTWTLSEPNNAYEWFPVKQSLTDKADSVWVFVTTSDINKVGSNGLLTATVPLPDQKVRYEWKSHYPIDYYLISIAVANYQEYSIYATIPQTQETVLIQNYLYNTPACLEENKENMDKIKDMMEHFSTLFGQYPFSSEKYGHSLAPMGGGMEHQTMTTQQSFAEGLTAHEFTHQWFGDNVTCASWEHIWINEGFATYGELLWNEYAYGKELAFKSFYETEIQSVLQYGRTGSTYVPVEYMDNEYRIFDGVLTYSKGACIVHMLRFELNDDELFFQILQTYQERFSGGTAVAGDFQAIVEELSGRDWTTFFEQWYYGEGYPTFKINWKQSGDQFLFTSVQTTSANYATPLFKMPFELQISYTDLTSEIVKFYQDTNTQDFFYTIPEGKTVKAVAFDTDYWLLAKKQISHDWTAIYESEGGSKVILYPNPTKGLFKVQSSGFRIQKIRIFDIMSRLLQEIHNVDNIETDIDMSSFSQGVYFIHIIGEGKSFIQKLIRE